MQSGGNSDKSFSKRRKSNVGTTDVLKRCPVCNRLLVVKEHNCRGCGWTGMFDRDPSRVTRAVDHVFAEDQSKTV